MNQERRNDLGTWFADVGLLYVAVAGFVLVLFVAAVLSGRSAPAERVKTGGTSSEAVTEP